MWAFELNLLTATLICYSLTHRVQHIHLNSHTRIIGQVGIRGRYQTQGVKDPSPTSNCHLHISWCTPLGHSTHQTQRLGRYNRGTHLVIHDAMSVPTTVNTKLHTSAMSSNHPGWSFWSSCTRAMSSRTRTMSPGIQQGVSLYTGQERRIWME